MKQSTIRELLCRMSAAALALPFAMALALGSAKTAVAQPSVESQIQKRQTTMRSMASSMRTMEYMVYGMIPSDPKAFLAAAQRIDVLAQEVPALFGPETGQGKTNARPEIWTKAPEFEAALKNFQDAVPVLKAAVADGDLDRIKTTLLATGRACYACHDKFVVGH